MSWYSDFKSSTNKLLPLSLRRMRHKIPGSENEARQNRYEFPSTSSIKKYLVDFQKMAGFYRSFCLFISKSLHFHADPSPNVSSILLFNGLVMVTNEGSIACKHSKKRNVGDYSLYSRIFCFTFEIFQISLVIKYHWNWTFPYLQIQIWFSPQKNA